MGNTPFKMKGWSPFTKKSPAKKGEKFRTSVDQSTTGYEHTRKGFTSEKGVKTYEKTQSGIKADMSKADLLAYVRANNKGKSASDASRISVNAATKIWRGLQQKSEVAEAEPIVEPTGATPGPTVT